MDDKTKKEKLLTVDTTQGTDNEKPEEPDTYRGHPKDIKFISGTTKPEEENKDDIEN